MIGLSTAFIFILILNELNCETRVFGRRRNGITITIFLVSMNFTIFPNNKIKF